MTNEIETRELERPCPACGRSNELVATRRPDGTWTVECMDCDWSGFYRRLEEEGGKG